MFLPPCSRSHASAMSPQLTSGGDHHAHAMLPRSRVGRQQVSSGQGRGRSSSAARNHSVCCTARDRGLGIGGCHVPAMRPLRLRQHPITIWVSVWGRGGTFPGWGIRYWVWFEFSVPHPTRAPHPTHRMYLPLTRLQPFLSAPMSTFSVGHLAQWGSLQQARLWTTLRSRARRPQY